MLSDTIVLTRLDRQCIPQNLIGAVSESLEGRVLEVRIFEFISLFSAN